MPRIIPKTVAATGTAQIIERGERFLLVQGLIHADRRYFGSGIELRLLAGRQSLASAPVTLLFDRPDVAGHTTAKPVRAFQAALASEQAMPEGLTLELKAGDHRFPLDTNLADVRSFVAKGQIDRIDATSIGGWLFDPALQFSGEKAVLVLDGDHSVTVQLDQERPELAFLWPERPPVFGFQVAISDLVRLQRAEAPGFAFHPGRPHVLSLSVAGRVIDRCEWRYAVRTEGKLEKLDRGLMRGWAVDPALPDTPINVEMFVDGARFREATAGERRADLIDKGISSFGGGYSFDLPIAAADEPPEMAVSIRRAYQDIEIASASLRREGMPRRHIDRRALLANLAGNDAGSSTRSVVVVVPIYNAVDEVQQCIEAVVRNTDIPCRLLLIDDASPDPRIAPLLDRWKHWPNIEVHRNPQNLGYTRTVNRGIALAGDADVVLLNSDTVVAKGWLQGLRLVAYSDPRVATATAVSNNAGAFSVPEISVDNALPVALDVDDFGRLVRQSSLGLMPAVPTGNGFCMYMRRSCIDAVGTFDEAAFPRGYGEENDFCMRALRAGFVNLVDDRSYVFHKRSASFGSEKEALNEAGRAVVLDRYPEYAKLTAVFQNDLEFVSLRWRVRRAMNRVRDAGVAPKPRVLFVISTQTGGTPQTNRDLMEALSDRYEPWVLRCDARFIELSRFDGSNTIAVEVQALSRPIPFSLHQSADYDARVADLLIRYAFELVHIRHIAWHGLGLTAVCRLLGIPAIFSFHDFYTVCPTVKLLDEQQNFCGGRCTAGDGDCTADLWPASTVPPLKHRFIHRWRELMSAALHDCDAFVTTSPAARDTVLQAFPSLREQNFPIIPHGRSFEQMQQLSAPLKGRQKLRVLVPGNISAAKGAALFGAIAALDTAGELEFHFLGDSGVVEAAGNVILHGRYQRHEFAERVAEIAPHIGVIFSIWPETYCHTLTEMWACGLPVAAFDIGAVGERVRAHGGGWLLKPGSTPAQILKFMKTLRREPADLAGRVGEVLDWQQGYGEHFDTSAMALEYDRLYRQVFESRRSFRNPAAEALRQIDAVLLVAPSAVDTSADDFGNDADAALIFRRTTLKGALAELPITKPAAMVAMGADFSAAQAEALVRHCQSQRIPLVLDLRACTDAGVMAGPDLRAAGRKSGRTVSGVQKLLRASQLVLVVDRQQAAPFTTGLSAERIAEVPAPDSIFGTRSKAEKHVLGSMIKAVIERSRAH